MDSYCRAKTKSFHSYLDDGEVYLIKNMNIFYLLLLLCLPSLNDALTDLHPKIIVDFMGIFGRPISVISTVCWPTHKIVEMFTYLSEENVTHSGMVHINEASKFPRTHTKEHYTFFLVDLACLNSVDFIKMGNMRNYLRNPYRWIILDENNNSNGIPEALTNVDILIDTEVLLIRYTEEIYTLYFAYKINRNSNWIIELFAIWDNKLRLIISDKFNNITALRRINLKGNEIRICYVLTDEDSINHLTDKVNDYVDTITKVNFPTTNHLLDFLNAKRQYYFANTWGYFVNGTWNGMTGYLVRDEVDIGGSPMFFTLERISFVDYIASPTPSSSKFVFQSPKLSYENNLFLLSFRTSVWYSIIGLIFLVFLVIHIVAIWEWKSMAYDETDSHVGVLRANIADIVILMFGAACQQGSPVELKGVLGRIVMLILFLALMFLYTSYSANIVALLQSSSSQIKTLEDLLNSRIKLGVHDTVFNRYYFKTATEPIRKAIYEKKVAPPGTEPQFMTMEEGIKKMEKGLFAFHMEVGVGYKFVGKYFKEGEKCGLREIQYLQVIDPYLAVQKNTPYKEMFKIGFKRIQEHGLQNRENRFLYEKRPKCSGSESNFISVSMVDCYPALLVLSYGTIIALVMLAIEYLWFYRSDIQYKTRHFLIGYKGETN